MTLGGVLEAGVWIVLACVLIGGSVSRRFSMGWSAPYWLVGWIFLLLAGALGAADNVSPGAVSARLVAGAIFTICLVAGAYSFAGRRVPKWLGLVALGLCAARAIPALLAWPLEIRATFQIAQTGLLVGAAVIAMRGLKTKRFAPRPTLSQRLVGPTLLAIAAIDGAEAVFKIYSRQDYIPFEVWIGVGIVTAAIQIAASFDAMKLQVQATQEELRRANSLLRATLESTADGIVAVDTSGEIRDFNHRFLSIAGLPEDVVQLGAVDTIITESSELICSAEKYRIRVAAVERESAPVSSDTVLLRDGRSLEVFSYPQKIDENIVGRVWSFRDVTKRREAEARILEQQAELKEVLAKRTRELKRSEKRRMEADRLAAVGTLAAGVAHQINNPVGGMLTAAQFALLSEGDPDFIDNWRDALKTTVAESTRCAEIVHNMLRFSRSEAPEKTRIDLRDVAASASAACRAHVSDRDGHISLEAHGKPAEVIASRIELEQMLVNLIRNSLESRPSGVSVEVRVDCSEEMAVVHVSDDGPGMSDETQQRLFDPFFTTKVSDGGTGLGLSVVHGIVSSHDGKISVRSSPGSGTSIAVRIPVAAPPA